MKNKTDKKIFLKFLAIVAVSGILGGIYGFFSAKYDVQLSGVLSLATSWLQSNTLLLMGLTFIILGFGFMQCFIGNRFAAQATEENEIAYEKADSAYELSLIIASVVIIIIFTIFGITTTALPGLTKTNQNEYMLTIMMFLLETVLVLLLQYLAVSGTKKLYPEKRGNIFDTKFQKEWLASCDEAEKQKIGEASYKAYSTMNVTFSVFFVVCWLLSVVMSIDVFTFIVLAIFKLGTH